MSGLATCATRPQDPSPAARRCTALPRTPGFHSLFAQSLSPSHICFASSVLALLPPLALALFLALALASSVPGSVPGAGTGWLCSWLCSWRWHWLCSWRWHLLALECTLLLLLSASRCTAHQHCPILHTPPPIVAHATAACLLRMLLFLFTHTCLLRSCCPCTCCFTVPAHAVLLSLRMLPARCHPHSGVLIDWALVDRRSPCTAAILAAWPWHTMAI